VTFNHCGVLPLLSVLLTKCPAVASTNVNSGSTTFRNCCVTVYTNDVCFSVSCVSQALASITVLSSRFFLFCVCSAAFLPTHSDNNILSPVVHRRPLRSAPAICPLTSIRINFQFYVLLNTLLFSDFANYVFVQERFISFIRLTFTSLETAGGCDRCLTGTEVCQCPAMKSIVKH